MHPSRIFDKPIGFHDVPPPLQVVGVLPDYEEGIAYEGRLDILNAIGDCMVELLDNNLPPGATATVDNATQEVVIRWPPYTPPETEKPGIINWDFQLETLEGWNDLRGNSWRCENSIVLGTNWATDGDYVGVMRGVGRGEHVLESMRYPATPGEPVTARSLWDQGPSNKDNNNLWTAVVFYGPGGQSQEFRGDRIHDRTNKSRHHSTVNVVTPPWAETKTVRLIAGRRNGRNRWIAVDDVVTEGFAYSTGANSDEDYCLVLRVRDSAGREALWQGCVGEQAIYLTSKPYGYEAPIEAYTVGLGVDSMRLRTPPTYEYQEAYTVGLGVQAIDLRSTLQGYIGPPEAYGPMMSVSALDLRTILLAYTAWPPEAYGPTLAVNALDIKQVLISQTQPVEAYGPTLAITGVTIT